MSRTVTKPSTYAPNLEMSAFGYLVAALVLVVMLPLVPFLAVGWLLWRALGAGGSADETAGSTAGRGAGRPPSGV